MTDPFIRLAGFLAVAGVTEDKYERLDIRDGESGKTEVDILPNDGGESVGFDLLNGGFSDDATLSTVCGLMAERHCERFGLPSFEERLKATFLNGAAANV